MNKVKDYLSLIKFSHTIFAMPFAMIGFFIGVMQWENSTSSALHKVENFFRHRSLTFVYIILCMIFARSAAMAFNRYLDRHIDAKNPRTAVREIPKGIITPGQALGFTIMACVLFVVTCFFINRICFYLSPIALLVVLGYSYTKRFTALCHLILGLGLSLAPIGAYLAVTGSFSLLPVLFSVAVIFWVSGFDIIYALQDEAFDKSQELYSIPAWLGKSKGLQASVIFHACSAAAVVIAGLMGGFGIFYWIGVAIFTGMLIYQHTIVKLHDLKKVNLAFMTANGIASIVFAIFVIADLIIH
ncbi:MAG TPA: UbiA-like polyprenyltransferase [Chitinophagaceae bacterium]|nr:UbiA-like polyprenyltransferase [Chitinophagaceae bacterium]